MASEMAPLQEPEYNQEQKRMTSPSKLLLRKMLPPPPLLQCGDITGAASALRMLSPLLSINSSYSVQPAVAANGNDSSRGIS